MLRISCTQLWRGPRVRLSEKKQSICARTDDPVAIAGKRKRQTFDGAPPGFPVNLVGFAELHAAFLNESRTHVSC